MYRTSPNVEALAARLGLKDKRAAVGLIVLLGELDDEGLLDSLPDTLFWLAIGGKVRGKKRGDVLEAYREYLLEERRLKEREKKRRQRAPQMSPEKGDKSGDKNGEMSPQMSPKMSRFEGDTFPAPSPPSPAPFLPPSPPTPPVTPYNPPDPNPRNPTPLKKIAYANQSCSYIDACARLGIDSAWKHSAQARKAVAQRLVDWISENDCPCARYNTLFSMVVEALENRVPPEIIMHFAVSDTGNSFSSDVYLYGKNPLFRRDTDKKLKEDTDAQT